MEEASERTVRLSQRHPETSGGPEVSPRLGPFRPAGLSLPRLGLRPPVESGHRRGTHRFFRRTVRRTSPPIGAKNRTAFRHLNRRTTRQCRKAGPCRPRDLPSLPAGRVRFRTGPESAPATFSGIRSRDRPHRPSRTEESPPPPRCLHPVVRRFPPSLPTGR